MHRPRPDSAERSASTRHHTRVGVVLFLASISSWSALGQAQPGLETLRENARSQRRDLGAQVNYATALTERGLYRQARSVLRAARFLDREGAVVPFELARVEFTEGSYHRTRAACRPMMADQPALGHVCRARAFLLRNRAARAFEELEAAIDLDPDGFEAWLALAEAHRLRAEVTEAERAFERAMSLNRESYRPHAGLGFLYVAANRDRDAVLAFRRALERNPDSAEVLFTLSRLVDRAERVNLLERAVTVRPQWAEALTAYGIELKSGNRLTEAQRVLDRAVAIDSRQTEAHIALGQLHLQAGRFREARAAFERAIAIVPNTPKARFGLAEVLAASGQLERAFTAYQDASALDPSNPEPHLRAARLALDAERDVLAAAFLDRVLERHPNLAAAHALYGHVMSARADTNSARRHYERALRGEGERDEDEINEALRGLERIASSSSLR